MVYVQGGALVDQCAVANPYAQQDSELQKYREVELSGLEPLTSCMHKPPACPRPAVAFRLLGGLLRAYWPEPAALNGTWSPPRSPGSAKAPRQPEPIGCPEIVLAMPLASGCPAQTAPVGFQNSATRLDLGF
jgi:hypothetical protein